MRADTRLRLPFWSTTVRIFSTGTLPGGHRFADGGHGLGPDEKYADIFRGMALAQHRAGDKVVNHQGLAARIGIGGIGLDVCVKVPVVSSGSYPLELPQ
jgi:hypothetical protein